jgi:hypothetical protein
MNGAMTRAEEAVLGAILARGTAALAEVGDVGRGLLRGERRYAADAIQRLAREGAIGPGEVPVDLVVQEVLRVGGDEGNLGFRVRLACESAASSCGEDMAEPGRAERAAHELGDLHTAEQDQRKKAASQPLLELARPLSVEMLLAARSRELLSLADLPHRHGLGDDLDRVLGGGLNIGDLVAIGAAGAGAGKTAFEMQIADGLALRSEELVRSGRPGVLTPMLIVSELSPEELAFRTIGRLANVAHSILLAGRSAERFHGAEEVDAAFSSAEKLLRGPLSALPRWQLVMRPHENRAEFMAEVGGIMKSLKERTASAYPDRQVWPVLIVDPIQRWQDPGVSEVEALNQLAEDLDASADREKWIAILTSDTNKNAATGETTSGVGAFRGSMKLQHACDVVLLLDGGEPVTDPGTPRAATVDVLKTRRGPAGARVSFSWFAGRGLRFEPAKPPAPPRVTDPAAQVELLRTLVARETARGTELTKTKLKAYREDLGGCPEKKLERLVDDAVAAGAVRLETANGRGGRRQRILPCPPTETSSPEHWSTPK